MRPRNYKYYTLLVVDWSDIRDDNTWLPLERAAVFAPEPCRSVGFFLNRDKEVIRLCTSLALKDKDVSVIAIPWGCITGIKDYGKHGR